MCYYASSFIEAGALLYLSMSKCHQLITFTSHHSCPIFIMSYKKKLSHHNLLFTSTLLILLLFTNIAMASPLRSGSPKHRESSSPNRSPPSSAVSRRASSPKWINPCHLPAHPIDAEKEFADAPDLPIEELFHNVISRAKVARNHARQVKEAFLSSTFSDPDFENSMKWQREEWLPEIPEISEETFKEFSAKEAFITAYEFMQYFAVGIEQILIDRVLHEGTLTKQFTDTEFHLFQLLCEIQLGMHLQGFKPNDDVMRDVMSHEYRDIAESSRRNARDYRILRDYIAATNFIARLFSYHKAKLNS